MKEIFLKTVRKDGSSVWAPPGLGVVYEIGKHYTFPKHLPAHVIPLRSDDGLGQDAYFKRKEKDGGSRLLICYGEVFRDSYVPFTDVWSFNSANVSPDFKSIDTSYDFDVIGEMFVPPAWVEDELPIKCNTVHPKQHDYLFRERNYDHL